MVKFKPHEAKIILMLGEKDVFGTLQRLFQAIDCDSIDVSLVFTVIDLANILIMQWKL